MVFFSVFRLPVFIVLLLLAGGCGTGPGPVTGWQQAGLNEADVQTVQAVDGVLFAGTGRGVFIKNISSVGKPWQQRGLAMDSAKVVDFVLWSRQELLAAVLYQEVRTPKPTLFQSMDGGESWTPVQIKKPNELEYFVIKDLEKQPNDVQNLFAYVGRIVKSTDKGASWQIVFEKGQVSEFLTVSPFHPNQIWTGGWTNIFSPYLAKSGDSGKIWTLLNDNFISTAMPPFMIWWCTRRTQTACWLGWAGP